jgi:flagellar basal-body rod protein FlgF
MHLVFTESTYMKILVATLFILYSSYALASHAPYIAISNDIAKQDQLNVVANNAANVNTIGFEQDDMIYKTVDKKESKKKTNSFVIPRGNFRKNEEGGLKVTENPLDLAIVGRGYFKILTSRGPRYTLAGHFIISSQNIIVNSQGYPLANQNGQPIVLPDKRDYLLIQVTADGTVYTDTNQADAVGIFGFPPNTVLAREGSGFYASNKPDIKLDTDTSTIKSGVLRTSNVNSTKVLTNMIELERSADASRQLVTDLANLERSAVSKIMK